MKVFLTENHCEVVRESHDPRFKDGGWGSAESTLLHHVKKELIKHAQRSESSQSLARKRKESLHAPKSYRRAS